jgi:hypothetical protein
MLSDAEPRELTGVTDHWDMKTGFARRRYQQARARYVPPRTRVLFVAQAPPLSLERYFYFEDVRNGDWLWIALMKELFPVEWGETSKERKRKREWLAKFKKQENGYLLIEAVEEPIGGSSAARVRQIKAAAKSSISEVKRIKPRCIVLIKATVFDGLFRELKTAGLRVMNTKSLPFPSSGRQKEFHRKFRRNWVTCCK